MKTPNSHIERICFLNKWGRLYYLLTPLAMFIGLMAGDSGTQKSQIIGFGLIIGFIYLPKATENTSIWLISKRKIPFAYCVATVPIAILFAAIGFYGYEYSQQAHRTAEFQGNLKH